MPLFSNKEAKQIQNEACDAFMDGIAAACDNFYTPDVEVVTMKSELYRAFLGTDIRTMIDTAVDQFYADIGADED